MTHEPNLTGNPDLDLDLTEERQRELLEEAEADRVAEGDNVEAEDYQPITNSEDDIVDTRKRNTRIGSENG